jgi:hypothetical protein
VGIGRKVDLKRLDAIGFDELQQLLDGAVHSAFIKAGGNADDVWRALRVMHREHPNEWDSVFFFMIEALRISTGREKA